MYMAVIKGWTEVRAFSKDEEVAKTLAILKKRSFAEDDLGSWTWENVSEFYGAYTEKIYDGLVMTD